MSSPRKRLGHAPPVNLLLWVVLVAHSPESTLAFLPSTAYSGATKVNEATSPFAVIGTDHGIHPPRATSLTATKCPPDWNVLDLANPEALSNPSYSWQNPLENPEMPSEKASDGTTTGKSTFQTQLSTYQPFWMHMGAKPKDAAPSSTGTTSSTPRQTQSISDVKFYATSFPAQTVPRPSRISKTFAIPKTSDPAARPSFRGFNGSSNRPRSDEHNNKNPMASAASNHVDTTKSILTEESNKSKTNLPSQEPPPSREVKVPSWHQQASPVAPSTMAATGDPQVTATTNGVISQHSSNDHHASSAAGHFKKDHNQNASVRQVHNGTPSASQSKQWYEEFPVAMASTGAKVVQTLSNAYAHPLSSVSLPVEETPSSSSAMVDAPSSMTSKVEPKSSSAAALSTPTPTQEQVSNNNQSQQNDSNQQKNNTSNNMNVWEGRLKAVEHAVTSMAHSSTTTSPKKNEIVVDTTSAPIPPSDSLPSASASSANNGNDWNLISKLRQQVESLKDVLHQMQHYETKTIAWSIPRIDKHLRLSSSTTFQSDPFYVNSIPFHLELVVQEANGQDDKDQSVSFFLHHHHWRTHYYYRHDNDHQTQYQAWPFQQEEQRKKRSNKVPPPIHVGGSKLKIGDLEFVFGYEAVIQVGTQDGWGWKHLMSLNELREHRCIRRGHLDIQFQARLEKKGHDQSRIGVAMIG